MKVAFFGDSITQQFSRLSAHKNVWNLGISGNKTIDLIGRFLSLTRIQPDRVLMMIGTNDYIVGKHVWQDYIAIDYPIMMDALFTLFHDNLPTTEVIVISIPPIRWPEKLDVVSSNQDIDRWNTMLQTKTKQNGFSYLDLSAALKSDDNAMDPRYTTDGVHFSEQGYDVFYHLVKQYLID